MLFFTILKQKILKSLIIITKTCTRIHIFKSIYLDGENDSDDAVKTKNAQLFMIFPNISFFHMIVTEWPGPLTGLMFSCFADARNRFIAKNTSNKFGFRKFFSGIVPYRSLILSNTLFVKI